ncbi:hypothetical protein KNE206_56990 [Kitasatospora sp. NE20-6]
MAAMAEQRTKMEEARRELEKATASATSKDRLITAKVGPQGQVVSLTFHNTGYREMAPVQLGALLTDVLNEARASMGEKVIASMKSFQGLGDILRDSMTGGTDLDELLAPLRAMKPDFDAEEAKKDSAKQEEFNG